MWLSDRRTFLGLALAATAGCGFTPVYGPGGAASQLRGAVLFQDPTSRDSFDLNKALEDRLGPPASPIYGLSTTLNVREEGVGETFEQEITRFNVVGQAQFALVRLDTGAAVTAGTVSSFTGYSVGALDVAAMPPQTSSTIATIAAKRDARARLMSILADRIVTRLIADMAQLQ